MTKRKKWMLAGDLLLLTVLLVIDQTTKRLAVVNLKGQPAYPVLDGILEFNYLENRGAAFGMLQNQKGFFIFVALLILGIISYVLYKVPDGKKYNALHILLIMIGGGALGNMIDRLHLDYVVDFIYFVFINFPIFNVADMYVTIAAVTLVLLFLFYYKEQDMAFLSFKQNKYREMK